MGRSNFAAAFCSPAVTAGQIAKIVAMAARALTPTHHMVNPRSLGTGKQLVNKRRRTARYLWWLLALFTFLALAEMQSVSLNTTALFGKLRKNPGFLPPNCPIPSILRRGG